MRNRAEPCRFGIVIYDGVEPIDLGATLGVISMARRVLPVIEAVSIAAAAGPVRLADGFIVLAAHGFADAPMCDIIIVCGGPGWRAEVASGAMFGFLRGVPAGRVASVCTGALILAAAGFLDGRSATTRRAAAGAEAAAPLRLLASLGTNVAPQEALVVDAGVVTGGGVSLAIDTTLYLIGREYGEAARDAVARVIEYDRAWDANLRALGIVESR